MKNICQNFFTRKFYYLVPRLFCIFAYTVEEKEILLIVLADERSGI